MVWVIFLRKLVTSSFSGLGPMAEWLIEALSKYGNVVFQGQARVMRASQQFRVSLPAEIAEAVEEKVKSGAYASVSEVMRDGVRALLERDRDVEQWLRDEVVPGHAEYLADPSKGVPADQIMNRIRSRRAARTAR
jgi:antitoxin ParD1/3/4